MVRGKIAEHRCRVLEQMERFYYQSAIADFCAEDEKKILGALVDAEGFDTARDQKNAWVEEIRSLRDILVPV